jgi:hypothetical protein
MSVSGPVEHKMPMAYYYTNGEQRESIRGVEALLKKWDSVMNDPSIPQSDRDLFKQEFIGYMDEVEAKDGFGPSRGEGFDDLLRAIETKDKGKLEAILGDVEDMQELRWGFSEAFKKAQDNSGVEVGNEADRLSGMLLRNDWAGLDLSGRGKARSDAEKE